MHTLNAEPPLCLKQKQDLNCLHAQTSIWEFGIFFYFIIHSTVLMLSQYFFGCTNVTIPNPFWDLLFHTSLYRMSKKVILISRILKVIIPN